jgi:hypothetical protein
LLNNWLQIGQVIAPARFIATTSMNSEGEVTAAGCARDCHFAVFERMTVSPLTNPLNSLKRFREHVCGDAAAV